MGDPPGTGSVWAIVVAGGSGERFGGPKQFALLAGRPVVSWSVEAARSVASGVVLVLPPDHAAAAAAAGGAGVDATAPPAGTAPGPRPASGPAATHSHPWGADVVVAGGATRSCSVRAGLAAVPDDADVIVVHDAARPLADPGLFRAVVGAVRSGDDGAIPGVPVGDTLKRLADDVVAATVDRTGLVAVQTPQAFNAERLRKAHADEPEATDDAALLEAMGVAVRVVPGDASNVKLTTPVDLLVAEALRS